MGKMSIAHAGSEYGGWWYVPELFPSGGVAISGGIGNDYSFDEHLIRAHDAFVVMVDPGAVAHEALAGADLPADRYVLDRRAIVGMGVTAEFGAERSNGAGLFSLGRKLVAGATCISALLDDYSKTVLLKLDIEGAEYAALTAWSGAVRPTQVLVGWHDKPHSFCPEEHHRYVTRHGYRLVHSVPEDRETVCLYVRGDRWPVGD